MTMSLAAAGTCILAGCTDATEGVQMQTTTVVEAALPSGFDACNLPGTLLSAEGLVKTGEDKNWNTSGSTRKWLGCTYVQSDGYFGGIALTTVTVPAIAQSPASQWVQGNRWTIDGRSAISYWKPTDDPAKHCLLNVEMKNGSLEFSMSNEPSSRKSSGRHACDIAKSLAAQLVPTIKPGS